MIARDLVDFEGWLRSHSAALAAWCVSALPGSDVRRDLASLWLDEAFASNVEALHPTTEDFPEDDSNLASGYALWTLPEYPLRMLARLSICLGALPKSIETLPTIAAKLWEARTRPRRFGGQIWPSRARATNIISSNIIDGLGTSESILSLAGRLLHPDWREAAASRDVLVAFRKALPTLRRMPGDVGQKLHALISVRTTLEQLPNDKVEGDRGLGWSRVEYNIVNSFFTWPLLVARGGGPADTIGLSIPVFIDVRFDDPKARTVFVEGPDNRLHANWLDSVKAAHQAAIDLWLKETGFFGASWRDQVRERAHAVFDVSAAEMLLETVGKVEWNRDRFEFEMEGRSLEVPTALSIFSQLRGLRAPFAAGSTGMLRAVNEADQDEEASEPESGPIDTGFDRDLMVPSGLVEKLEWADAAGVFDKLIFPAYAPSRAASRADMDAQLKEQQRLQSFLEENSSPHRPQINFCKRLSHAADAAFRGQWRRTQFVRCPEVSELLRPEEAERFGESCRRVMEILATSTSSIVIMPDEITLPEMCGAMAWLNLYGQDRYQADLGIPPMLAVAFLRLVPDEGGDRLCAVLCDVARAPVESVQYVCSAGSEGEQGRRLADVLNKRVQDQRHPGWRAPDLIVCAIPGEVLPELKTPTVGSRRGPWRHSLSPLLTDEFSNRLQRIADERWGDAIGCVRVVFVADGDIETAGTQRPDGNKQESDGGLLAGGIRAGLLLAPLSIFRSEFSQQEAALLANELGLQGGGIRRALLNLEQCGYVKYAHGSWRLTKVGRKIGTSEAQQVLALGDLHAAAAIARAPYLSSQRLPGLSDFEARRTDRVHEAQFHVAKALAADISQDQRSWLQACRARLALHFDVPGWGLILQAASDRDLTKERPWADAVIGLGEQLLASALANREEIGPDRVASLFRAMEQRKRRIEAGYPTYAAAQQNDEWRHLTEMSLSLADRYAGMARGKSDWGLPILGTEILEPEQIAGTISLVTILLAGRYRLTTTEKKSLSTWLSAALPLVPPDVLDIPPTWFEQQGDGLKSHSDAREWYERGYLAVPGYIVNWIKALGCLAEDDDERMDRVISDLNDFVRGNPDQWKKMKTFAKRNKKWELARNARWNTGIQYAVDRDLLE